MRKKERDTLLADEDDKKRWRHGSYGAEKDGSSYTSLDCFESGELASKTRYREVSVSICIIQRHAYEEEEEVRVARAARFYRFRASACSRAAANCSLMQASERAGALLFLGVCRRKASLDNVVNDENAMLAIILCLIAQSGSS